jgi:hypothetical protein
MQRLVEQPSAVTNPRCRQVETTLVSVTRELADTAENCFPTAEKDQPLEQPSAVVAARKFDAKATLVPAISVLDGYETPAYDSTAGSP